jgi:TPR repeat protein
MELESMRTTGRIVLGLFALLGFLTPAAADFAEDCRLQAQDPQEPGSGGRGVPLAKIDSKTAVTACWQARFGSLKDTPAAKVRRGPPEPEPETIYRQVRAYLAEGPYQDIGLAGYYARRIEGEMRRYNSEARLGSEAARWYSARARALYDPKTHLPRAKAGDPVAQMTLYYLYRNPSPSLNDEKAASYWLAEALAQNHREAVYQEGWRRVRANDSSGVKLVLDAAIRGYSGAQWEMADLFMRGKYVRQDRKTASGWARLAAEQGHEEARLWLRDHPDTPQLSLPQALLGALIAAAVINGLREDAEMPKEDKEKAARDALREQNSRSGNCRFGFEYNMYTGQCEDYAGRPQ